MQRALSKSDIAENLIEKIKKAAVKYMLHEVWKVLASSIVRNKRIPESVLEVNGKICFLCKNNNFIFVDNKNVSNVHQFDYSLHLVESGRCILANNVTDCIINTSSRLAHTHTHDAVISRTSLRYVYRNNMQCSGIQILHKLRLKYRRNPLTRYLNIHFLRNKITATTRRGNQNRSRGITQQLAQDFRIH